MQFFPSFQLNSFRCDVARGTAIINWSNLIKMIEIIAGIYTGLTLWWLSQSKGQLTTVFQGDSTARLGWRWTRKLKRAKILRSWPSWSPPPPPLLWHLSTGSFCFDQHLASFSSCHISSFSASSLDQALPWLLYSLSPRQPAWSSFSNQYLTPWCTLPFCCALYLYTSTKGNFQHPLFNKAYSSFSPSFCNYLQHSTSF